MLQLKFNVYFCTKIVIFFELNKLVIISDLGDGSFELALLKSQLNGHSSSLEIIELSHQIPIGGIVQAAFLTKNCYQFYQKGTVFYLAVGLPVKGKGWVMLEVNQSFFVAPDNGILHLIFGDQVQRISKLKESITIHHALEVLLQGESSNGIFETLLQIERKILPQIQKTERSLLAYVHFVDHFGNLYINISKQELDDWLEGSDFTLRLRRDERLSNIVKQINDVGSGDAFAVFSEDERFLIAGNNMGDGSALMGLKVLDKVIFEKR